MTQAIRFGDWVWQPDPLELRRGVRVVTLEPRVARLLDYVLEHPGELLTHDHLVEAVWGGRIVSNEAVRQAVFGLRQALAVEGAESFIRTVHKKGYIAEFPEAVPQHMESPALPEPPVPRSVAQSTRTAGLPFLLAAAVVVILATITWTVVGMLWERQPATTDPGGAPIQSPATIAVLPFINLSRAAEGEILADGLAEELLGTLALNPDLRVTARPSAFQFTAPDRDLRDIGRRLGVRYVVDGSVRNLGERVRIHTRLVDAQSGKQLWSHEYDRLLADWFDLQQLVAAEVTGALDDVLQQYKRPVPRVGGTANAEAYLEVLRARQLLSTRGLRTRSRLSSTCSAHCCWIRTTRWLTPGWPMPS